MSIDSHPEKLLNDLGRGKRLSRRQFMTVLGAVAAGEFVVSQLGPLRRVLAAGTAGGSADGVTVFLYLGGGNDGINTVVPLAAAEYNRYASLRTKTIDGVTSSIAYPMPGTPNRADSLLVGDANIGFNPGMVNISSWYRGGKVAVVQGVGYSNANFSHFESQEHWWGGSGAAGSAVSYKPPSGWLGRFADTAGLSSIGAISINSGGSLNPSLRSVSTDALAISPWQGNRLGASTSGRDQRAAVAVRAMAQQTTLGSLGNDWSKLGGSALDLAPVVNNAYTGIVSGSSGLKRQLTMAANLIGANLGTRVIHTDTGGFDTHENQRKANNGVEWHTGLWMDIDDSLNQFFALLSPANRRRVNVVIYSEFGRRADMNGNYGTDHGAGSVAFVIGDNVKGGRYGEYPSLLDLRDPESDGGGNLKSSVDFRQLWATVLQGWLGVDAVPIIGATHQPFALFAAGPGDVPGQTTTTTSSTTTSSTTTSSTTTSTTTSTLAPTSTIAPTSSTIAATTTAAPTTVPNPTTSIVTTTTLTATTVAPTTVAPTTVAPTTVAPTTVAPTTVAPTTVAPTTVAPTTVAPTTVAPTTVAPTTVAPTTVRPTTVTTSAPATTLVSSTTTTATTTTTTKVETRTVPPMPKTTPSPSTPDTVNTVTESVVAPAPPPAEPAAPVESTTTSTAAPTNTTPTTAAPDVTTSTQPVTTASPSTTAVGPTTTRPGAKKTTKKSTRGKTQNPPRRLALTVDESSVAVGPKKTTTKRKTAASRRAKTTTKAKRSVVSRLRNR